MIYLKSKQEIEFMRQANHIVRDTLNLIEEHVKVGVSTLELNVLADNYIRKLGGIPSFLNYDGFPASICVSIDDEVVHGIPNKNRLLEDGSIVSVDIGAILKGYHGDAARTFCVGTVSAENKLLIERTKQSFFEAVKVIKIGARIGDIGFAISNYVKQFGYGVVRDLIGHGIGQAMHESPEVPNFGKAGHGVRIERGLTIAIEPMINLGGYEVNFSSDGWTVKTRDGKPSAHYENTLAVTDNGVDILSI